MSGRFIDFLRNLTAKSTTIDGSEQVLVDSSGLPQKATLSDALRYGGGNSTRITTVGNANIHQKSDGTMWLEVTGQTAGNARGAGAFDWQAVRTVATQVASGVGAVAIGDRSVVSGANAIVCGSQSSATGDGSVVLGFQNSASGSYAATLGGRYLSSANRGQVALSGNATYNTSSGEMQCNVQNLALITSDATATALRTDSGNVIYRMVIPAMRACAITGIVTAMSDATDGYKVKAWEIKCVITRDNSNNTRIVGTPVIVELGADTEAAGWAITSITADNTNESLAITVTGEAATNIRWQGSLFYGQVGW